MQLFSLLPSLSLVVLSGAVANAGAFIQEEKRQVAAGCISDGVLRALSSQSSEAASLCPSLIRFQGTTTVTVPVAGATSPPV